MAQVEELIVELSAKVDDYNRAIKDAMGKTQQETGKGGQAVGGLKSKIEDFVGVSIPSFKAFAVAAGGAFAVKQIVDYGEEYTNLQNKIRTVLDPTQDLTDVTRQLLDVSNESRTSLESTTTLYTRLKRSTEDLGISNQELFNLTETINKSFAVSGATAEEAAAAITQLSQGLASGALRGDEFNSVAEQAPIILEAVAAATGMSRGELRDLAAEGKITSEVLIKSLQAYSGVIETDFSRAQLTVSQASEKLANNLLVLVGEFDKTTGLSSGSAEALNSVAESLLSLQPIIKKTGEFFTDLSTIISESFTQYVDLAAQAIDSAAGTISSVFSYLSDGVSDLIDDVGEDVGDLIPEVVRDAAGAVQEALTETANEVVQFASDVSDATEQVFDNARQDRLQREQEAADAEVEIARNRQEQLAEIEGGDLVQIPGDDPEKDATDKKKREDKEAKEAERLKAKHTKELLGISKKFAKEDMAIGESAVQFTKDKAATSILAYAAEGAEKVISQLGLPGIPIAGAILAGGAALANKVRSLGTGGGGGLDTGGAGAITGGGGAGPEITTREIEPETATFRADIAGDAGATSQMITISAPPGDSIGEALADWINDGIRKGRIEGAS
jgi:tape measure domain-containing protein